MMLYFYHKIERDKIMAIIDVIKYEGDNSIFVRKHYYLKAIKM